MLIELVCCSVDDCEEAKAGGAHRVELCHAIELGGLTPSLGLLMEAQKVGLPLMVMIRPRGGGFCLSESEFLVMQRDLEIVASHAPVGVVFGVLKEDSLIDVVRMGILLRQAEGLQTVFHRAFDRTPDPFESLEQLIDLGVTRVLTSGHAPTALDGAESLKMLCERACGRIEVLAGGAIRPANVKQVVSRSTVSQVHAGLFRDSEDGARVVDRGAVEAMRRALV